MADSSDEPADSPAEFDPDGPGALPMLGAIAFAIIIGVGAVGWLTGTGWFSYRTILYGSGELYAINLGESPRTLSVDGRSEKAIPPNGKNYFDLVGGTSSVDILTADGETIDSLSVTVDNSDALVKVSDKGCLTAVDVSFLYNPNTDQPNQLPIDAKIQRDDRLYIPKTPHVVWPRESIPKKLTGADTRTPRAIWIETCGCELLESGNRHLLDTYLSVELQSRLNRGNSDDERRRPAP